MNFPKIDSHSHVGIDSFGMIADIDEYKKNAVGIGIEKALVMPVPSPVIVENNKSILPCVWEEINGEIKYYKKKIVEDTFEILEDNPINPYKKLNDIFIKNLLKNSDKNLKFYSVGLIHPKLDSLDYLKELCDNENIYALKIHGVGTYTGPNDVSNDFFRVIKSSGKPLVVHVDYFNKEPKNSFDKILLANNPIDWVKKGIEHGIKLYITHSAKSSLEAVNLARGNENIAFGISPDLLIPQDIDSIYIEEKNTIKWCLENIPNRQLFFDIDYSWNAKNIGEWDNLEWNSYMRIIKEAKSIGMNNDYLRNIFYNNSIRFFNL